MRMLALVIVSAAICLSSSAANLSLETSEKYVFTDLRDTNCVHGVGIGTNRQDGAGIFPLRLEDWTYCYEAAQERTQTANANRTVGSDDGSSFVFRPERRMSVIPNVNDYIHIYQSIYEPLASTNAPYLLSDGHIALASSVLHAVTNDYGVTIATNDGWVGYHNFFEHPTYLTSSNGFRRILSTHNVREYLYYNLEAAKGMRFVRRGYAGTHSNRTVSVDLSNVSWTYDNNDGWVRHDPAPNPVVSWVIIPSGRINDETYRYYRQLRKSTTEAWRYDQQSESYVYAGSRNGTLDYVWRSDEVNTVVTNYLSMTNGQEIVGLTHVGITVDYVHERTILDCDQGNTNHVFGSGKYFVPLTPSECTVTGSMISVTLNYDVIAKRVMAHVGQEVHPSEAGPVMASEINYPTPLQDMNVEYRTSSVIDDMRMKVVEFSGIVRMQWNARIISPDR